MNCRDCGLENLPHHAACAFCDGALPGEDVDARRTEWESLKPALREEFSKSFERQLQARRDWLSGLRRRRMQHAVGGALLNAAVMGLFHAPVSRADGAAALAVLVFDALVGAGLGLLLNRVRGGEMRGALLFGGSYIVSTFAKIPFGVMPGPVEGGVAYGFFVFPGILVVSVLGYLFGFNLSAKRSIEE